MLAPYPGRVPPGFVRHGFFTHPFGDPRHLAPASGADPAMRAARSRCFCPRGEHGLRGPGSNSTSRRAAPRNAGRVAGRSSGKRCESAGRGHRPAGPGRSATGDRGRSTPLFSSSAGAGPGHSASPSGDRASRECRRRALGHRPGIALWRGGGRSGLARAARWANVSPVATGQRKRGHDWLSGAARRGAERSYLGRGSAAGSSSLGPGSAADRGRVDS